MCNRHRFFESFNVYWMPNVNRKLTKSVNWPFTLYANSWELHRKIQKFLLNYCFWNRYVSPTTLNWAMMDHQKINMPAKKAGQRSKKTNCEHSSWKTKAIRLRIKVSCATRNTSINKSFRISWFYLAIYIPKSI